MIGNITAVAHDKIYKLNNWCTSCDTPITITKESKKAKVKKESDYDSEFSEVLRRARNIDKYQDEISRTIADAAELLVLA